MSYGLVICSACGREAHQGAKEAYPPQGWFHCENKTAICAGASAVYPSSRAEIKGKFCGADDFDRIYK